MTLPFRFLAPRPRFDGDTAKWAGELRRIEDLGFHAVTVTEHYAQGWELEPLAVMCWALASTTTLRVMPLVLNADLHSPVMLARAAATMNDLSGGRAALGLGAGWQREDYRAVSIQYAPAPVRVARLATALHIITARPPRVPLLVAAGGPRMLTLAGQYADIAAVHARLGPAGLDAAAARDLTRESVTTKIRVVRDAAAQAGRAGPEIQFSAYDVTISGVRATKPRGEFTAYIEARPEEFTGSPVSLHGDPAKIADDLHRYREELGITWWHLGSDVEAIGKVIARL